MTPKQTGKREPPGLAAARDACRRLHARGEPVTTRRVVAEVASVRGEGVSMRDATTVAQEWRAEQMARVSGRVETAVASLLALETDLERDAVRLAVQQRTGGGIRLRFTVAARHTGGGPKKRRTTPLPRTNG